MNKERTQEVSQLKVLKRGSMLSKDNSKKDHKKLIDYIEVMNKSTKRIPFNSLFQSNKSLRNLRPKKKHYLTKFDNIYVRNPQPPENSDYLFMPPNVLKDLHSNDKLCRNFLKVRDSAAVTSIAEYEKGLLPIPVNLFSRQYRQYFPDILRYYCSPSPSPQDTSLIQRLREFHLRSLRKEHTSL